MAQQSQTLKPSWNPPLHPQSSALLLAKCALHVCAQTNCARTDDHLPFWQRVHTCIHACVYEDHLGNARRHKKKKKQKPRSVHLLEVELPSVKSSCGSDRQAAWAVPVASRFLFFSSFFNEQVPPTHPLDIMHYHSNVQFTMESSNCHQRDYK